MDAQKWNTIIEKYIIISTQWHPQFWLDIFISKHFNTNYICPPIAYYSSLGHTMIPILTYLHAIYKIINNLVSIYYFLYMVDLY